MGFLSSGIFIADVTVWQSVAVLNARSSRTVNALTGDSQENMSQRGQSLL